jgi:hypothetical protein
MKQNKQYSSHSCCNLDIWLVVLPSFTNSQIARAHKNYFVRRCSWFVMGVVPIVLVRNSGGLVQGMADMHSGFTKLNRRLSGVLQDLKQENLADEFQFEVITDEKALLDRLHDDIEGKKHSKLRHGHIIKPFVYIMLNNPSKMRKLIKKGEKRLRQATILQDCGGGTWQVRCRGRTVAEEVSETDIKVGKDKALVVGEDVQVYQSAESVFSLLLDLAGEKDNRARALFIIDEGDLAVGGPDRNKNKGEEIHFIKEGTGAIASALGARQGAREYAYGSISITATPAALMLCAWPVQLCVECNKAMRGGTAAKELQCKSRHCFCLDCAQNLSSLQGQKFQCPVCLKGKEQTDKKAKNKADEVDADNIRASEEDAEGSDEGKKEEEDKDGYLSQDDIQDIVLPKDVRSLRLHVVRTDRPRNYVCYEEYLPKEEREGRVGFKIIRENTEEREDIKMTKIEVFKRMFLGVYGDDWFMGDEEEWQASIKEAHNTGKSELWDQYVTLRRPTPSRPSYHVQIPKLGSALSQAVADFATGMLSSYKTSARSVFEIEVQGLVQMLTSMNHDTSSPFRHALISSEKTTNTQKQAELQDTLVNLFSEMDLAVARYDYKGVSVKFTAAALQRRPTLIDEAVDLGRKKFVQIRHQKDHQKDLKSPLTRKGPSAHAQSVLNIIPNNQGFSMKNTNINVMYEILREVECKKSVVITGHIGGRGVSYHDISHSTILTDMYTAVPWAPGKEITLHGEHLIQLVGRLNTIYNSGEPVPCITLWAPPSFHELHKAHIEQIEEFVGRVQELNGSVEAALETMSLYISEIGADGKPKILRITRGKPFAEHQKKAKGKTREHRLPDARPVRPPLFPWEAPCDSPVNALCALEGIIPQTAAERDNAELVWDNTKGEYSMDDYILWAVKLPSYCKTGMDEELQSLPDFFEFRQDIFRVGFRTRSAAFKVWFEVH